MQAKVLAPAATKTDFGKVSNDVAEYDYDKTFGTYHSSKQVAEFLGWALFFCLGIVLEREK